MKMSNLLCVAFLVVGCTTPTRIHEDELNKVFHCKDLRDGEEFEFNTNDVTHARRGYGTRSSFRLTDSEGRERVITSASDAWLKCHRKDLP